ncbi:MAG: triose-phosphate isomerase [Spirochaetes bacterium]|nr:triose-phosphate isomerase [Spirochaetota bacterium]
MKKRIIAGNWKMYKTSSEAKDLVHGILNGMKEMNLPADREVLVFPPVIHVKEVHEMAKGSKLSVGVQNMYFEAEGAFTGEISPKMVKDAGAKYILIGHSERRHIFKESDELLNKKVKAAYDNDLIPMLCIGELLEEYEAGKTNEVCKKQLVEGLKDITADQAKKLTVAYEPVWAIGTGKVATPEIAESVQKYVRSVLADMFGQDIADLIPILYGGSAKPDNAAGLLSQPNVDGLLIGGACLKADSFLAIAKL